MTETEILRRTQLFDAHRALGARIVPFAGFEMPVQYAGIVQEHDAVRKKAGLFDLSHMAQFELRGDAVATWADTLTINHVATMKPLQARYNVFTNDHGGAHDDVIFYRLPDRWLLVVNAANAGKMWSYLEEHAPAAVRLENLHGARALIAVQGPRALEILQPFVDTEIAGMKYYTCIEAQVGGHRAVVARTGYTGEDGFEVFLDANKATSLWDALLAAGRERGLQPAGLGARDMLRLEAGMPLYGFELSEEITPLQAGLSRVVRFEKDFVGKSALEAQRDAADFPRIAGLVMEGRVPARTGYRVRFEGRDAGEVRSGSVAPSLENKSIATALLDPAAAEPGTRVEVEIRGNAHPARVVSLPFYARPR